MIFSGHFQGYVQLWVTSIYVFVIWGGGGVASGESQVGLGLRNMSPIAGMIMAFNILEVLTCRVLYKSIVVPS